MKEFFVFYVDYKRIVPLEDE